MKKKNSKLITSTFILGTFLFFAYASGNSENVNDVSDRKINISNQSEVKKFLLGNWTYTDLASSDSENKYYRIEIKESNIIFNWKIGWSTKFNSENEEVYSYELSDVYPGENEGDHYRLISVAGDISLGYRIIDPLQIKQNYDGTIGLYRPGAVYEFERATEGSKDYWYSNNKNIPKKVENSSNSELNNNYEEDVISEEEYNRQQEQAEYESSQAYYGSNNENNSKSYFDQNGNSFNSIQIGNQIWMNNNLNVDKFRNGDPIAEVKTQQEWVEAEDNKQPACCYYDNDSKNGKKYGKLYNWYAVNDSRGLTPSGWHVPNVEEWSELSNNQGGDMIAGLKLKSKSGWNSNKNSTNESEFSALPGGYRHNNGQFLNVNYSGYWWTSTSFNSLNSWLRQLHYDNEKIFWFKYSNGNGFSIRCVKN